MSVIVGTPIASTATIDAIFNDLFQNRANTQGTIAYSWSDPNTIQGVYADGSFVQAKFFARQIFPTAITQGSVTTATLASVAPNTAVHGAGNTSITVTGTGFASGATVYASGTALTTGFTNATTLTATILAAQLASAGTLTITVTNADGQGTNSVPFTVT